MTIKDITEAIDAKKARFGIRQAVKNKKNIAQVFVAKDARDETIEKLEKENIEFIVLKPKSEMTKNLNVDFESEVISIQK